jgi:DNA-binding response OmpR family regulator
MAHNLLLVDESPLIHRVVELTLEGLEISVFSAKDTDEAMTLARSLKPTFIVASTTFKRNSGFDLCRALKDDAELGNIPILLLSSAKENVTEQEALEVGAIGVLTKPFEPKSLLAHVQEAISSAPPGEAAPEPEAAEDFLDEDDAFLDIEDELLIEDTLTGELADPLARQSAFDEDDALSDLMLDADEDIPPLDQLDDTLEETTTEAPPMAESDEDEETSADTSALAEESAPGEDMNIDDFLDEFGADVEDSASVEISTEESSSDEEASTGKDDIDPMQLALEHTLADEFETLAEKSTLTEVEPSDDLLATNLALDEFLIDTPDDSALEAAEAEFGSLQAELGADFGVPDDINKDGLEHLVDDQVKAVEDELASLKDELAAEEDDEGASISEYGTSSSEAENFLEELVFREGGSLEESPVEADGLAKDAVEEVIDESGPSEDDLFWEQLEIEADELNDTPPESPEIYAIPYFDGDGEVPPESVDDVMPLAMPQEPSEDADRAFPGANVQKSLERTVETIVPTLLRRIEDIVVALLPEMVEKIVIREIDKIKRGE